ncbi:MAG: hypothetical protein LKJ03_07360 [Enterococcaceae bacterium]|nr:hypothetical protein [Enterococcaceae bacterium]
MGLFGLFKKGRKKSRSPKKNISKQAGTFGLALIKQVMEQNLSIINDSYSLINKTTEPKVFFSRYDTALSNLENVLKQVRIYSNKISVSGIDLEEMHADLLENKSLYIDKLIQRMAEKLGKKIDSLTTDKAKDNHINKFKDSFLEFNSQLSPSQIEKISSIAILIKSTDLATKNNQKSKKQDSEPNKQISNPDDFSIYDQWNISIGFGKSSSKNFEKALYLAKNSDRFVEDTDDSGNNIYQAFYFAKHYLDFQRLFKLVGSWKSTFVFINGETIDNKSLGKINICFGDKLKFNDPNFCYGASEWTSNPFGCHRLMLTPSQTPWWSFGSFDKKGNWIIDKQAIKEKINYKSVLFRKCPSFNQNRALLALELLPDKISKKDSNNWYFLPTGVMPTDYNRVNRCLIKSTEK